ncbi:MAG: hypothetical protein RR101_15080 [Burkholderiaceae bacterium]
MFDAPAAQVQSVAGDHHDSSQFTDSACRYNEAMEALEQALDLLGCIKEESREVLDLIGITHPEAREVGSVLYLRARAVRSLADSAGLSLWKSYDSLRKETPLFPLV